MFSTDTIFFPNNFYPWLAESSDAESLGTEEQLYTWGQNVLGGVMVKTQIGPDADMPQVWTCNISYWRREKELGRVVSGNLMHINLPFVQL